MFGRGWNTFTKFWEGLAGPPTGSREVGRFFRRSGSSWEALPEAREWSGDLPKVWEALP